jgi:N6-L-threonylcarbamoyladenine synthase
MPNPSRLETPLVLGIETSCDETSAAVVSGWRQIRSNVVVSQDIHAEWGGVVPELASREHLRTTMPAVREALEAAGAGWGDLSGIAVTSGPGLVGSLLVGISVAKSLSLGTGLPLVGVNHLEGHLFSLMLEDPGWRPPYVVLIVSGGHTEMHLVRELGTYVRLGATVDDAAGEAFDKIGVLLGFEYPAGPRLDAMAEESDAGDLVFPVARVDGPGHAFSFSGLKTAVLQYWQGLGPEEQQDRRGQVAAAFRNAVVQALITGLEAALDETGAPRVAVAGGVANNRLLRREVAALAKRRGIEAAFPSPRLCTDNAAMIAAVGAYHLAQGRTDSLELDADPSLRLVSAPPLSEREEDPPGGRA